MVEILCNFDEFMIVKLLFLHVFDKKLMKKLSECAIIKVVCYEHAKEVYINRFR